MIQFRLRFLFMLVIVSFFLYLAVASVTAPLLAAPNARAQVWGQRPRVDGYWGAEAYMTTPNPNLPSGQWAGGPTGVTNLIDAFIESGVTKACDIDCGLHPYGSWHNSQGNGGERVDTTIYLGAGLTYRYYSTYIGGRKKKWESVFCSGGGCASMIIGNVRKDTLPYVASGGESSDFSAHWGNITTSYNIYKPFNSATGFHGATH